MELLKLKMEGMLSLKAICDNVDDMLDAQSQFEEDQTMYKEDLEDIVTTSYCTKVDDKFIFEILSFYKYKLN